jgi:predicted metal-binding membrane protein
MRYPEWQACFFSLLSWAFLVMHSISISPEAKATTPVIYCVPTGTIQARYELQSVLQEGGIVFKMLTTISNGFVHWIEMVAAMMFPLLVEPVRHVAFSVRRKDRTLGVLGFLIGYTTTWAVAGPFFLLLPLLLDTTVGDATDLVKHLVIALGFLGTAILSWRPGRLKRMAQCRKTVPLRIHGWRVYLDSQSYGLKMGLTCLKICWASTAAVMLAHNLALMYAATIVLISERYLVRHTSWLPGYAWTAMAITLFAISVG